MKLLGGTEQVVSVPILTFTTTFSDTFLLQQILNLIESNCFESYLSR